MKAPLPVAAMPLSPAQPRVILQAPPPTTNTSALSSSTASGPATFTPTDSPLLAHFDSKPHGEAPQREPEFAPSTRQKGWQVSGYPAYYGLGVGPYYGGYYGPGSWGGPYGYGPYYGGYYGYPRGLGLGLGLGVGFGIASRPYYAGHYGHGHALGYGGGHAHVTGGHAGRVR